MLSTIGIDIRDFSLSSDGKDATFVLVTKHSGEIQISLPAHCLAAFASIGARPNATPDANGAGVPETNKEANEKSSENVTITVPQKWYVGGDPRRRVVIVVLDPKTSNQSGFALHLQAAKEVAAALVKKSDELASADSGGPSTA